MHQTYFGKLGSRRLVYCAHSPDMPGFHRFPFPLPRQRSSRTHFNHSKRFIRAPRRGSKTPYCKALQTFFLLFKACDSIPFTSIQTWVCIATEKKRPLPHFLGMPSAFPALHLPISPSHPSPFPFPLPLPSTFHAFHSTSPPPAPPHTPSAFLHTLPSSLMFSSVLLGRRAAFPLLNHRICTAATSHAFTYLFLPLRTLYAATGRAARPRCTAARVCLYCHGTRRWRVPVLAVIQQRIPVTDNAISVA